MTPAQAKRARKAAGLTQERAAAKLHLTQAYLSMLERGKRPITPALAERLAKVYGLRPVKSSVKWTEDEMARQLGGLGYPGFAYLRSKRKASACHLVAWALQQETLDARLVEGLPWVLLHHEQSLDWAWLVQDAKLANAQNRLGFLMSLACEAAERLGKEDLARRFRFLLRELEPSRLAAEDTFFGPVRTERMREWLREQQSSEARHWGMLTDVTVGTLRYIE